jgi:hypothetical protein
MKTVFAKPMYQLAYDVLQISEGTNSVGIVRWDLGFCLCAVSSSSLV